MFPEFLSQSADTVAKKLLGCFLERTIDGQKVVVRIVETEAYDQDDAASHAYGGKTLRNQVMFGECGHLYVYLSYGMHYCCNVVTGQPGYGSGVLIRAVEPVEAAELLEQRRGTTGINVTNGPAKLCQALMIDRTLSDHHLRKTPLRLLYGSLSPEETFTQTTRIGISKATDKLRRYYITGNHYVSKRGDSDTRV